ncbi:MAG: hypothetical protein AAF191_04095 [Verrucomicrobiota bacterium]
MSDISLADPAKHWPHLRSTNPIESMFAALRLRPRPITVTSIPAITMSIVNKRASSIT